MLMASLTPSDAIAIHRAIHAKPTAAAVTTKELGVLVVTKTSYGNGRVDLPHGLGACVGANPKKSSKYGRKMRAGGAVTLVNPLGTYGYESRCIVIESFSPSGSPTIASGLQFGLPKLLTSINVAPCGKTCRWSRVL
jgi:hypothetical protein